MKILKHREVIGPLKQSWDPDSGSPREEATLFNATLCAHTKDDKAHVRVPWTARRSNQFILKEISPGYSLEGLMLKLKL